MNFAGYFVLDAKDNILGWVPKKEGVVVGSVVNTRRGPTQIGAIRTAYILTDAKLDSTDIEWRDVCRPG
jgi:hypothetical protein